MLTDIEMPEMDGFEVTKALREVDSSRRTPIIAMTAHTRGGVREKCLASGMNDHVGKPIDPGELFSLLVRWIRPGRKEPPSPDRELELPRSLPGIDMESGLARLEGNKRLYRSLLRKVLRDFIDYPESIRTALKIGDLKDARLLAHTIKGVAGNIGAFALQRAASALEEAAGGEKRQNLKSLFEDFEIIFKETIGSLLTLGEAEKEEAPHIAPFLQEDPEALLHALEKLEPHLHNRKPKRCSEAMQELRRISYPKPIEEDLAELERLVAKYKYTEALAVLSSMRAKLS